MLQDFKSVSDHFTTLRSKGLILEVKFGMRCLKKWLVKMVLQGVAKNGAQLFFVKLRLERTE